MTTVGQMIDRTLMRMGTRNRLELDTLTAGIDDMVTSLDLDLDHKGAQGHGSILEVGTEQMFVMSYSSPTYTVIRGWNGTTAAAHSLGDLVYLNPRFPRSLMTQVMSEEIRSWPDDVGKVTSVELTLGATASVVDSGLGAGVDLRRFLALRTEPATTYDQWRKVDFLIVTDKDASDFASGYGVQLQRPLGDATTLHLHALVGYTLTDIATESTNLNSTVGVTATMEEALLYGMISRAMSGEEINRTNELHAQQAQRDERVPPTYLAQTMSVYTQLRDRTIVEETRRINAEFPYTKTSAG